MKLYEIKNEILNINEIENEEEKQEFIQAIQLELTNKSNAIIGQIKNVETEIEQIKIEIDRLTELKKAKETKLDNFKKYVKENMEQMNLEKIETSLGTLSLAKCPISVEIVNEEEIPNEYIKVVQKTQVDKKAIADNFKSTGEIIDGVNIINNKRTLRIK